MGSPLCTWRISQAIHADFVQKHVSAVELLQFGVYRGIELSGWYDILNVGYRFPCVGASDYPACRTLGDCQTYVALNDQDGFAGWLKGAAEGRSFVTTGPLLLLEVDGERPGGIIRAAGTGPHRSGSRSESKATSPRSTSFRSSPAARSCSSRRSRRNIGWASGSSSIGRSSSTALHGLRPGHSGAARSGAPDAEAHTNPVYVDIGDKAPYNRDSLDRLIAHLDQQMAVHRKRSFAEKARVLDYFQKSRDILLRIRQAGGLPAGGVPDDWIDDHGTTAAIDPSRRTHADTELAQFLQPLPAKTAAEAQKTFEAVDGFRVAARRSRTAVTKPGRRRLRCRRQSLCRRDA